MNNNKDTGEAIASGNVEGALPAMDTSPERESKPNSDSEASTAADIISCRNGNYKFHDLLPDSGEELLGSVTFAPIRSSSSTNPGPVRTSARVIQKMRQDNRPSTPPTAIPAMESKASTHVPKTPTQPKMAKKLWSNMERTLFFEALNEYGKDFDAITQHINQKMRRKVVGQETASCKSREQIRQMYLQSFHKASKYLKFSDGEYFLNIYTLTYFAN